MRIPGLYPERFPPLAGIVCLALASLSPAAAGDDLYTLYQQALSHDMKFAAVQVQAAVSTERQLQRRADLLPSLSATGGAAWVDREESSYYRHNRDNTNAYAVVLTQPLLRWQNVVAHDQSKLRVSASEVHIEQARQALMLRVARAYLDVLLAREGLNARTQQLQTLAQQQARIEHLLGDGATTRSTLEQVQARHDEAQAELISARGMLDLANETLAQLTASHRLPAASLGRDIHFSAPQPASIDDWASQARTGSLAVQAAQIDQRLAQMGIERERAGHLPTVDLIAAHGRFAAVGGELYDVTLPEARYRQTVVGIKLDIPLYAGGRTSSKVREAHALEGKAEDDLEDARRDAALAARRAYLRVSSGLSRYAALRQSRKSSEVNLTSVTKGFEAGARINTEVLDAQQQFSDADLRLAEQRHTLLMAQLELLAATGSLNDASLMHVSSLLQ